MEKREARRAELEAIRDRLPRLEDEPALVGVGNEMRGDDGFGVLAARELEGVLGIPVYVAGPVPENYLGKIARTGARSLLVLDAVDFGGAAGELRLLAPGELTYSHFSSHLPPLQLMELFLSEGGVSMQVLAVQPATVAFMAPLTEAVRGALEETVAFLRGLYGGG